jgi:hypothetical protein
LIIFSVIRRRKKRKAIFPLPRSEPN